LDVQIAFSGNPLKQEALQHPYGLISTVYLPLFLLFTMRNLLLLLIGIVFGITLTKGEIISWYRIQEMFRFQSFHMYGVIGSAVVLGVVFLQVAKAMKLTAPNGAPLATFEYPKRVWQYLLGGTVFGLGWALTGACPGPMYILLGNGFSVILVVIGGAFLGTLAYGYLRPYLPH
jgi:uncharacterized membrane protein YedE/YeeE